VVIAMDAGNSTLKAALVEGETVGPIRRLTTDGQAAAARVTAIVEDLDRQARPGGGGGRTAVALVSVVPAMTRAVRLACTELGADLFEATSASIPIATHLAAPDLAGADRLLDAWAASDRHGVPVIVVDMGTATTVDAVDAAGWFRGGAILPGLELGLAALADRTAQLPRLEPMLPDAALGRDTASARRSGAVIGHLGAIRELVARMTAELGTGRPTVVVTGGLAAAPWARDAFLEGAAGLPPIADVLDPQLTLRGLVALASRSLAAAAARS
jgi:type III pantothenate kinase